LLLLLLLLLLVAELRLGSSQALAVAAVMVAIICLQHHVGTEGQARSSTQCFSSGANDQGTDEDTDDQYAPCYLTVI
jgi:hypothetical protein